MFAIMPPDELALAIDKERKEFARKYNFIKALKPPVHMTLYEPFKLADEIESGLGAIRNLIARQKTFVVNLYDFNFFVKFPKPVIFIDVERTDALSLLQKELLKMVNSIRGKKSILNSFNPHFTICYREDISPGLFNEIREEYIQKHFSASFVCNAIYLWKHNGANWQVQKTFEFGKGSGDEIEYGQQILF
jgi:2'-5' RNA ligase